MGSISTNNINPDEAVACGAAVQAAILSGQFNENNIVGNALVRVLSEVTPLSLGLRIHGEIMAVIIPRNTIIPTKMEDVFTTSYDNQTQVSIPVYEGERKKAIHNNLLGKFVLEIPPAPLGVPKISVCFEIDDEGMLHVSAKEKSNEINNRVTIINDKGRLSKKEIERMISEANKYKAQDEMYRNKVEARHALEQHAYNMRNAVNDKDISSRLSPEDKKKINDAIDFVLKWLEVNMDAEQEAFHNNRNILSSVFDPIFLNMLKKEDSAHSSGSSNNGKKRLLLTLAKYALKIAISAAPLIVDMAL